MTAPLPRHCFLAGMPRGSTWAELEPVLRKRLEECRRRGKAGHWTYDLNQHVALGAAVYAAEAALRKDPANVE